MCLQWFSYDTVLALVLIYLLHYDEPRHLTLCFVFSLLFAFCHFVLLS